MHGLALPTPSVLLGSRPSPAPPRGRSPRALALAATTLCLLPLAATGAAATRDLQAGDFFDYHFYRSVGSGTGEYDGYSDHTDSSGRYVIASVNATALSVQADYNWSYSSTEGLNQAGSVSRRVEVGLPDRLYAGPLTDLDEYDGVVAHTHAAWFFVPHGLAVGDRVLILNDTFTVTSVAATIWSGLAPHIAIELNYHGGGVRNDAYGSYSKSWDDAYFFDAQTGWFVAERYVEQDEGTYNGQAAGFTWTEDVDVTGSSYPLTYDFVAFSVLVLEVGGLFAFFGAIGYAARWAPRTVPYETEDALPASFSAYVDFSSFSRSRAKVRRIRSAEALRAPEPGVTENFAPFLADLVGKALQAGDRVAVAMESGAAARLDRTGGDGLVGLAIYNREGRIGWVMCKDTGLAEGLRKFVGAKDFFTETRHPVPKSAYSAAREMGTVITEKEAYNVFDTFNVLRLQAFPSTGYDTALVSRMTRQDLPALRAIAKRVYKVRHTRWLRAQIDGGDIGFVARVDGKVVGFAFASLAGTAGRLHTLTVLPEYRNRGIGRELLRARLAALQALGATSVISEIAQWNLASMELAVSHGFAVAGTMYVETARRKRIKRDIVRRW